MFDFEKLCLLDKVKNVVLKVFFLIFVFWYMGSLFFEVFCLFESRVWFVLLEFVLLEFVLWFLFIFEDFWFMNDFFGIFEDFLFWDVKLELV